MAEAIVISVVAKIAAYTVAPVGRWLYHSLQKKAYTVPPVWRWQCYLFHFNSNIENLEKQEMKLRDARYKVQNLVDVALRDGMEIFPDVSMWLTDVDRNLELSARILRESEEEASTRNSNVACLNLRQRHQLRREAKKIVVNIAELCVCGTCCAALPSKKKDYNKNIENMKKPLEKLQHRRERVQHSVDVALRNGKKIFSDVSQWLTDVDRITELATKILRESEEEAGTRSPNGACLNFQQQHQISREAEKMVVEIVELLKDGNFPKDVEVSYLPTLQNMVPEQS